MAFNRPTLKALVERYQTDFSSRLPGADSRLRRSVLAVMARVQAGTVHLLYGFVSWVSAQTLPDSAEAELLDRHGGIWGITRKAASYARGQAAFVAAAGTVIPEGARVRRGDATEYRVFADAVSADGQAVAELVAVSPGAIGNEDTGATMSLTQPISGVQSSGAVSTEITGGADEEADEDLRGRILERIRKPPHGGCPYDYVAWAKEVSGVTRAWVRPFWMGLGTVGVLIVCDDQEESIIPGETTVAAVQAYIDDAARRPVTADVYVVAPTAKAMDVEISGLNPQTEAVRSQVAAELLDLLRREAIPGGTILLSHIREAISTAVGEVDHVLVSPAANVAHEKHEIAVMGDVTWS